MKTRFLVGLGAAFLLLACGNDGLRRERSNEISINKDQLYFQRPPSNQYDSEAQTVQITSTGELPLKITNVYLEGDLRPCDRVALDIGPFELLPGELETTCSFIIQGRREYPLELGTSQYDEITIIFHLPRPAPGKQEPPVAPENPTGRLVIESEATLPEDRVKYVELSVGGETPKIAGSPGVLTFSPTSPGEGEIRIRNTGTGRLLVTDVQTQLRTAPAVNDSGTVIEEFELIPDADLPWELSNTDTRVLTVVYTPADAEPDVMDLFFKSNDTETPSFKVTVTSEPVKGLLQVSPRLGTFKLEPGVPEVTVDFTFTNSGLRPVDVLDMQIIQPKDHYRLGFTGSGQPSFQLLGGGEMTGTQVTYHPTVGDDPTDAVLYVSTDADNAENVPNDLAAQLTGPKILAIPLVHDIAQAAGILSVDLLNLDFSDVQAGASAEQTITLTNVGGAPLVITRLELSGPDDADWAPESDPEFTLASGGGPRTLAPGGTHPVVVRATREANDINALQGSVLIVHEGSDIPDIVTLTANALPAQ